MALFNFNSNKEVRLETTYRPNISSGASVVSSDYQNTVWEGKFPDMEIGDGFVKQDKKPKQNTPVAPNGREYIECHSAIEPLFSKQDLIDLKDPEKAKQVHEKKILKIKNSIRQIQGDNGPKFPINQYDVEVFFDGRYYSAYVYDISTRPELPKLSQSTNITRPDGIKIGIQDNYEGDIDDDDNGEFISISRSNLYDENGLSDLSFTITLANGQKHTFEAIVNGGLNLVDLRRQEKSIAEYFADLPQEKIQELIDKNVTSITFFTEPDEEFADLYEFDENGECIHIYDDEGLGYGASAEITSPRFAPPKHNYHTEHYFERSDGYKITNIDDSQASSNLIIETQDGETRQIHVTSNNDNFNTDVYHQITKPKLEKLLNSLPQDVMNDILNEVDEIKMTAGMDTAGVYAKGSNTLAVDMHDDSCAIDTHHIAFIHELGHAIDNVGSKYLSESPEFLTKFEEFQKLAEKYEFETLSNNQEYGEITSDSYIRNHALDNSKELFASVYANMNYKGENKSGDHIAELDEIILPFKDSDDTNKKHCYNLYIELKNMVKETVDEVRTMPRSERVDNRIRNIVSQMCQDIQGDVNYLAKNDIIGLIAYSPELTITNWVSRSPEEFNKRIENFTQILTDERYSEDSKQAVKNIINKLQEIRTKVEEMNQ